MRKLAHVEVVKWKRPIEGADKIELIGVLGWQCVAKKDEFQVGDTCVYIEIDSILDRDNPNFAFLESRKYKIKTVKMRGEISQGICFPMSILPKPASSYRVGDDITKVLNVQEVEDEVLSQEDDSRTSKTISKITSKKWFKRCMKWKWFRKLMKKTLLKPKDSLKFPSWIKKTDEVRLQSMPDVLETYKSVPMVVTEKVDGTSATYGYRKTGLFKKEFVVCSRNLQQSVRHSADNKYWKIAEMYNIERVLKDIARDNGATKVILQGEILGDRIQGNKYQLKGIDIRAFNLIIDDEKVDSVKAAAIMKEHGIDWVPIINTDFILLDNVDDMIKYADGKSQLCDTLREGVVIRDHGNTVSFKCISNEFLLKHKI